MPSKSRSRSSETLAELIHAAAGDRGTGLTYDQLAERSVDPETGYQPSANLLNRIARGLPPKVNPQLIRAITAGLGLPPARVEAAAHREYIGPYAAVDPGLGGGGEDDEVIRAATRRGATPRKRGGVGAFVRTSRDEDADDRP